MWQPEDRVIGQYFRFYMQRDLKWKKNSIMKLGCNKGFAIFTEKKHLQLKLYCLNIRHICGKTNSKWITIALNAILLYETDKCFVFAFMYCNYFSCICFTLNVFCLCLYVYISTVYTDHVLWICNLLWMLNHFVAFYCAICIIMVVSVNWIVLLYFF